MAKERKKVLIIGAGLAGLGLYLALDKAKFDVEIVERRNRFTNLGFAVIFMSPGIRALRKLGFSRPEIKKIGKPLRGMELRNEKGEPLEPTHFDAIRKQFDEYVVSKRADLYSALWKRIPTGAVRFGIHPTRFTQKKTETLVHFSGKTPPKTYDLVVAADGGNSRTREMIFPKEKVTPQNKIFVWAWFPRKNFKLNQRALIFVAPKFGLGFLDVRDSKYLCGFLFGDRDAFPKKITPASYTKMWNKCFNGFSHPFIKIRKFLPGSGNMYFHEDRELNLKKWYKGSIVFIGDAAHARSVLVGAGTAIALEDGVVLGEFLNKKPLQKAIRSYMGAQYERVKKLVPSTGKVQERLLSEYFASSLLFKKPRKR